MTVQTDVLQVLNSLEGQKALKKAANAAVVETLKSQAGQKALSDALESDDGQLALRTAVQDKLRDGFAKLAPIDDPEEKKLVHKNQEWLFDTVGNMNSLIIEVWGIVAAGKEKIPG
jgi:hypothetical protein